MPKISFGPILMAVLTLIGAYLVYDYTRPVFNLSAESIARDLDGRVTALPFNQVWPFDASQNIGLRVVNIKYTSNFADVVVSLKATALTQSDAKEKLPPRVALNGLVRLHYEYIEDNWYLINVDNISLKASPINGS